MSSLLGGEKSGKKKEKREWKIKSTRKFVYRLSLQRERVFYFLAPRVNSTVCMNVGFFEEERINEFHDLIM